MSRYVMAMLVAAMLVPLVGCGSKTPQAKAAEETVSIVEDTAALLTKLKTAEDVEKYKPKFEALAERKTALAAQMKEIGTLPADVAESMKARKEAAQKDLADAFKGLSDDVKKAMAEQGLNKLNLDLDASGMMDKVRGLMGD